MKKVLIFLSVTFLTYFANAQLQWVKQDTFNLPSDVEVYYTNQKIDTNFNVAYYVKAKLKSKQIQFETDTTVNRRLTPLQFYNKNNNPLVVVNGTFFSFETNKSLNIVIDKGKVLSQNLKTVASKQKDSTIKQISIFRSALGIDKKRNADIAWIKTDSGKRKAFAQQYPFSDIGNNKNKVTVPKKFEFKKWKVKTAIGGGPVLLQQGKEKITNDYELLFAGKKGLTDKHPRTAMGYTADGYLIILVVQGRMAGLADGVSLKTLAQIMQNLGCIEALNLDGGGSSCMLVNGKETIKPCDKTGQRAIPAIFMIQTQ